MSVHDRLAPPQHLRERVLEASLATRPAGRATPAAEPIVPVEAFRRAMSALDSLLADLSEPEWKPPVLRDLDVQGLIGHLIGVEDDVRRALTGDPQVADLDHVNDSRDLVQRQRDRPGQQTRQDWLAAVAMTLEAFASTDAGSVVAVHGVRLPVAALCVARTFELWTHENDIRRATGRPATAPDASTLTLMTTLAVSLLPSAAARAAQADGCVLRLVLTGPGGGTWQLPLGVSDPTRSDPPRVGIVCEAVSFCRVVANRLHAADLDRHVTGDDAVALAVLTAAATLALD